MCHVYFTTHTKIIYEYSYFKKHSKRVCWKITSCTSMIKNLPISGKSILSLELAASAQMLNEGKWGTHDSSVKINPNNQWGGRSWRQITPQLPMGTDVLIERNHHTKEGGFLTLGVPLAVWWNLWIPPQSNISKMHNIWKIFLK